MRELVPIGIGFGGALAYLLAALEPASGREAVFAAAFLCLLLAAAGGPFGFSRREGPRRGALRGAAFGAGGAFVCAAIALDAGGPLGAALLAGLFCGLYAWSLGAVGDLVRFPLLPAAIGILVLGTLHYWDDLFLLAASDRKGSAALAFDLNPAAAVSVSLGYDWIHAKALYTNNQTAESLVGLSLPGLGALSVKLAVVGGVATLLGRWRRR